MCSTVITKLKVELFFVLMRSRDKRSTQHKTKHRDATDMKKNLGVFQLEGSRENNAIAIRT
jgi:hypothetical protein